jgi:hypothetical protein
MTSLNKNVNTLKARQTNVVRYLSFLLLPLLPLAFLLDLVLFFVVSYEGCLNCGFSDVVKKGIFCRLIIKAIK